MLYFFITSILAISQVQKLRSVICGCSLLSPSECVEVEWCELSYQFDKCLVNNNCVTYKTEDDCQKAQTEDCAWLNEQCYNKCELLEFNTCQDKVIDTNCSQFNNTQTCQTYTWCKFNNDTQTCDQILYEPCSSIYSQIECEDYGCLWQDDTGCNNNNGDCSQYENQEECEQNFQDNRQCIWYSDIYQVNNTKSQCFQSKDCSAYTYGDNTLDICASISNCKVDSNQCSSCVQDMFTYEYILSISIIIYLL